MSQVHVPVAHGHAPLERGPRPRGGTAIAAGCREEDLAAVIVLVVPIFLHQSHHAAAMIIWIQGDLNERWKIVPFNKDNERNV